jgi:hypothetical protein
VDVRTVGSADGRYDDEAWVGDIVTLENGATEGEFRNCEKLGYRVFTAEGSNVGVVDSFSFGMKVGDAEESTKDMYLNKRMSVVTIEHVIILLFELFYKSHGIFRFCMTTMTTET